MRDFKFDIDIILKNCNRFGIRVSENTSTSGKVTMEGKLFNVREQIENAFSELGTETSSVIVPGSLSESARKEMTEAKVDVTMVKGSQPRFSGNKSNITLAA